MMVEFTTCQGLAVGLSKPDTLNPTLTRGFVYSTCCIVHTILSHSDLYFLLVFFLLDYELFLSNIDHDMFSVEQIQA